MVGQFFGPAEGAAIPKLVKPKSLMNALALFNITFTISQALGLIIIGPLVLLTVPLLPLPNFSISSRNALHADRGALLRLRLAHQPDSGEGSARAAGRVWWA